MTITRGLLENNLVLIAELSTKCYSRYITGLTKQHQEQLSGLMGRLSLYDYMIRKLINSDAEDAIIEYEGKKWIDLFLAVHKSVDKLWPHLEYRSN